MPTPLAHCTAPQADADKLKKDLAVADSGVKQVAVALELLAAGGLDALRDLTADDESRVTANFKAFLRRSLPPSSSSSRAQE